MPLTSRALEATLGGVDAQRADQPHPLADRDAQRRMMAPAADQQHGGVVERIAGGQFRDDVALVLERLRPAEHGRVQGPQPLRGNHPGDQPFDRCVLGNRQRVRQGRCGIVADADDGGKIGDRCRRSIATERFAAAKSLMSGSDTTMAAGLIPFAAAGASAQEASTTGDAPALVKACDQLAARTAGDDQDRTLQRHAGCYAEL